MSKCKTNYPDKAVKLPLPPVKAGCSLPLPHFPTKMQAFVFRSWEMVPVSRLAMVLNTTVENVVQIAENMGLPPQKNTEDWLKKGYITIIKNNWSILPYDQLLQLLGWDEEKLAYVLKEDDFLSHKLGGYKFDCEPVQYAPLTEEQQEKTKAIKEAMLRYVRKYDPEDKALPFDFFSPHYRDKPVKKVRLSKYDTEVTDEWVILDCTNDENTKLFADRFIRDYRLAWDVNLKISNTQVEKVIVLKLSDYFEKPEYHEVKIKPGCIEISAVDAAGILRGLTFLEDMARAAGGPYYQSRVYKRSPRFETRYIYSYCGLYGDVFDVDTEVSYPDELLYYYSKVGINGIWAQAVLYKLTEFSFEPRLSKGWQKRLERLNLLVQRAKKFGIRVYLYLNEPRAMPLDFFEQYKELKGHTNDEGYASMCTTASPLVLEYVSNAVKSICRAVPDLGGFFTITLSENLTNCYSRAIYNETNCPRCKGRKASDIVAGVNSAIANAASEINKNIKTFALTWAWKGKNFDWDSLCQCISKIPPHMTIMNVSEDSLKFAIGGVNGEVIDYTMSMPGPSERSRSIWDVAMRENHPIGAKVQINNTWECSTVPFIPVFGLVRQHMSNLCREGISSLMLSWTLGGWPSPNIKIASHYFFEEIGETEEPDDENDFSMIYGDDAELVKRATEVFDKAFGNFPFSLKTLYYGPQNIGVANLLFDKPTGIKATMTCFAYDDLETWRADYPADVFENQFKLLSETWKEGLDMLSPLRQCELTDISKACYIIFKSSYNQIRFIRARDKYLAGYNEKSRNEMMEILMEEMQLAIDKYRIMLRNPTIGYEAANHYYYNRSMIMEKIISCIYLLDTIGKTATGK